MTVSSGDAHLPAIEADRDLDDWGRSARFAAALDRTVGDAVYKVWFRVEVDGLDEVPGDGPALLVAPSAGVLSPILPLVAKAVRDEHRRRRDVRICVPPAVLDQPGVSLALTRAGAVAARERDVERLLATEGRLCVVDVREHDLPDERAGDTLGASEALVAAVRSDVPVIPVAAVGGSDAQPVLGRVPLPGGRRLPVTLGFPLLGPAGLLLYLPSKIRLRALPAVRPPGHGTPQDRAHALGRDVARRLRRGREALDAERGSRWLG